MADISDEEFFKQRGFGLRIGYGERQAVGDRSAAAHNQRKFDLDAKYADVVEVEDAISYLQTIGSNVGNQPDLTGGCHGT